MDKTMNQEITPNRKAFLDMIAHSEIGDALLAVSDNGYNVLVGSTASHPMLFDSYDAHPGILNHTLNSTAAGRYQIIHPTYAALCAKFDLYGFDPDTQDQMALDLIAGRQALALVDAGHFELAVRHCSAEWASLPGSTAGQHVNQMSDLRQVYLDKGGELDA